MNTNISKFRKLKSRKGFSLIELLVVIAVIGIIAAIAIPNIANLTGGAEVAKDQRNAQTIASVSSAAVAAGYNPTGSQTQEVQELIDGITVGTGPNAPTFKINMTIEDYNGDASEPTSGADHYLTYAAGTGFTYNKNGATVEEEN